MRAVVQRVKHGKVTVDKEIVGAIEQGLVVLLGVGRGDDNDDVTYMADKLANLRIFEDADGKMNLSVQDIGGSLLVISQFTLYGDARKGRRPGFTDAEDPVLANMLYEEVVKMLSSRGIKTEKGIFQADMLVEIANDGPVTILLDSNRQF